MNTFQLPLFSYHLCWPHHLPRTNPNQRDPTNPVLGLSSILRNPPRQSRPPRSVPLIPLLHLPLPLLHLPLPRLHHHRSAVFAANPHNKAAGSAVAAFLYLSSPAYNLGLNGNNGSISAKSCLSACACAAKLATISSRPALPSSRPTHFRSASRAWRGGSTSSGSRGFSWRSLLFGSYSLRRRAHPSRRLLSFSMFRGRRG